MPIEKTFDIPLIAAMALREKQIQQNYRPIIGVHRWFARRPGILFRGLVLSEFSDEPLAKTYFRANNFPGTFRSTNVIRCFQAIRSFNTLLG